MTETAEPRKGRSASAALWAQVLRTYDHSTLIVLTNPDDRQATCIDTETGVRASTAVRALWPTRADVAYNPGSDRHIAIAVMGVVAMLLRRCGQDDADKWDEVFAVDGLMSLAHRGG